MNEAETRAELIDPKLKASGWGVIEDTKILREHKFTHGRIQTSGGRFAPLIADYVLSYHGIKLAVIEAKSDELGVGEGVAQAKLYAEKMKLKMAYSTNGKQIYQIDMEAGKESLIEEFPTPQELWDRYYKEQNDWLDKFLKLPYEDVGGSKPARYYQEIAVNKTMEAIAKEKQRILLTLATGTGKTFIAFQIAWKLFQTRWNLKRDGSRRPRILFLADRNILANQAFNDFSAFPEDALVRISPSEIKKKGSVPTNGSIFFTIFQTFMSGTDAEGKSAPYFGEYPEDYFDFIIIDECHRGGANDESNWRDILDYFSPAVQLGLTATPKRKDNVDTYRYFGEPVYIYSLKEGINDGFLTPFKVKRIQTTLDEYIYTNDDIIVEGEIEEGRIYKEAEFNVTIEIIEREKKRVEIYLKDANQNDKAIIFCANQAHAAIIRDLVNQVSTSTNPHYCVRVTANDGEMGDQYLREFKDNEKTIPTILTSSQKLSTGVDARNIRNIVLMRPIRTMIEFKQIIGRGTRLFDGKYFFTIYDYVNAYEMFLDPEWDGEIVVETCSVCGNNPCTCEKKPTLPCKVCGLIPCVCPKEPKEPCEKCGQTPCKCVRKVIVKLADGKERQIQHMTATSFWDAGGTPISSDEFLKSLYGTLPSFFKDEEELRKIWSNPLTRKSFLEKLSEAGFGKDVLLTLQQLIDAENSDLFDVLEYVSYAIKPISRAERASNARSKIFSLSNDKQKEFLDFVLSKYIESGVDELDQDKLPSLLELKYHTLSDAKQSLGEVESIRNTFIDFQRHLYQVGVA